MDPPSPPALHPHLTIQAIFQVSQSPMVDHYALYSLPLVSKIDAHHTKDIIMCTLEQIFVFTILRFAVCRSRQRPCQSLVNY